MASVVDICNLSLGHLGDAATVASIAPPDGSRQAALCAQFYPVARDQVLESHTWGFNTVRSTAAPVTNPLSSWQFAYALPSNILNMVSVLPPNVVHEDRDSEPYIIEQDGAGNGVVYTNVETATFRYTIRVTDTTKFSASVVVAIARLLAAYLAGPLLKGKVGVQTAEAQMQLYDQRELPRAKESDASSQRKKTMEHYQPLHLQDRSRPDHPDRVWRS